MKYLLLLSILLAACTPNNARLATENPIKENSETEAPAIPSLAGSWLYLLSPINDPHPRGYQYNLNQSGSFERYTFTSSLSEGKWTTKLTKATGVYVLNGEQVSFEYATPGCLGSFVEDFTFKGISQDGFTATFSSESGEFKFTSGDVVSKLKDPQDSSPCPRISLLDEKSTRKPASKVK